MADDTIQTAKDSAGQTVTKDNTGWMSDVQRAIALILIGTFAIVTISVTIRLVIAGDLPTLNDMAKTLQAALVNMGLVALGFFFGNTMAKMAQDVGQQKVVEKLTSPPPNGPVAPVPSPPAAEVPWWNRLTDAERTGITSAAGADPGDTRLAVIASGPITMKPMPDDLAYLVAKGLLTQDRATAIQGG